MNANQLSPEILKTKQHFEVLDGLRGIAAPAIVLFHCMEMVYMPSKNFIAHVFLAVDFFFCLSGFVIAYAYDDRIEKIGSYPIVPDTLCSDLDVLKLLYQS
ncbi:hypothetical protein SAMN04487898_11569 [Pedobacter sp. ok626]|nr:hypothetical protein SAMN04487898_11569 [Pedobacter sp. ok626]